MQQNILQGKNQLSLSCYKKRGTSLCRIIIFTYLFIYLWLI